MIVDFRKHASPNDVTTIKTQPVQYVDSYKYLGTIIDFKLNFEENCIAVCKKGHQRLHCLRKLFFFQVDKTIMTLFYRAFIESIVSFSLVSWFGSLSIKNRNSLNQVVKWSSKLVGESQPNPASLYTRQVQRITESILNHRLHPLHKEFQLLPSGKRFLVPRFKTKRFKNSFVPAAITLKNKL
jgi:hypothetical protein